MEGRKKRRETRTAVKDTAELKKQVKEPKPINVIGTISKVLMLILTFVLTATFGIVIYLKVLPNKYLIPICILVLFMCSVGIFFVYRKKTSNLARTVLAGITLILLGISTFVGLKLVKTLDFLNDMTTETVNAKTFSVIVKSDSKYNKLEDIQYRLLLYYDTDLNQNKQALEKITNAMTVITEKTDDVHELADRLIKGEVDAILIEDSYYAIIEEEMADFKEKTKVIYTFALEDAIATITKDVIVTEQPFIVYVSGIDSYGKISSVARSDVNMIAVVNPKTKQILLVNTPRDYYVKLHGTSGYRDKLTHAGIYGIDMSVKTMEDLYDVDINYYVRVNFTSLIKIIDAIGGVSVYSEHSFTSRIGNYKFEKGYNQMNGKQALGFARERYSFSNGDRMRGQNQQAVIDAMVKKVSSSTTILTKFDALLDSLKGSFQTNMEYTKMLDIVRMQITDNTPWNVSSISVDGAGSRERTYSMGKTLLSVLIPYAGSINKAETMIKAVLNGELLEQGNIDISSYNDRLVVPVGVYENKKEEKEEQIEQETQQPENGGDTTTGENNGMGNQSGDTSGGENTQNPSDNDNTGNAPGNSGNENDTTGGNDNDNTEDNNTDNETDAVEKPENNTGNNTEQPENNESSDSNSSENSNDAGTPDTTIQDDEAVGM